MYPDIDQHTRDDDHHLEGGRQHQLERSQTKTRAAGREQIDIMMNISIHR